MTLPIARLALLLAGTAALGAFSLGFQPWLPSSLGSSSSPGSSWIQARAESQGCCYARPTPADSIYSLAVDSTKYRDYPFVYLLDDAVFRVERDGRYTKTHRQVVQILKPGGVEQWAERRFTFGPARYRVKVNWMRVVSLTGKVLSDRPSVVQESDVPAGMDNPVYTQTKVLRYSLGGVAPGTIVDASWTVEQTKPALPGEFDDDWNVTLPAPGLRFRYVLDVPASVAPGIVERHLDFKRTEREQGGRHIYTWATQDLKPVKAERFAPDSSVPLMNISVAAPLTWGEIGHWYNDLSKDRYVLTPAIITTVDSMVRAATTRHDTLAVLHKWIAQDMRYVSVALGLGDYQPRFPKETVGTRYGDCKDKATLFIAAARHLGFSAYPVLLYADGGPEPELPQIEEFDHVIAAVQERADDLTFIDLTTFAYPTGVVASSYQGGFGLLVYPDGKTRDLTFPRDSVGMSDWRFEGELSKGGLVSGRFVQTETGLAAYGLRISYTELADSAFRAKMKRGAPKPFADAVVDTVILPDGRDWVHALTTEVREHDGRGGQLSGTTMVLSIPSDFRAQGTDFRQVAEQLQQDSVRKLPIDAEEVMVRVPSRNELRLTLPEGWVAQLPPSVSAVSDFGTYRAEYSQTGRELRIVHTTQGAKGVYPAARIKDLIAWLRLASKDDAEFVTITVPRP